MAGASLAQCDPAKYFQSVFRNLKKTSVDEIQCHIDSLNDSLFSSSVKALLYKFAGNVFLNDESTRKAAVLLERSLQFCSKVKKSGRRTQLQFDECRTMLALCFIRNYDKLDEAKSFLTAITENYQKSVSIKGLSLGIRARLGLVEYILVHARSDLIKICRLFHEIGSSLDQLRHAGDEKLAASYNCCLLAFDYNYLLASYYEMQTISVAQKIMSSFVTLPRGLRIGLARELFRFRNFIYLDAKLICSIVSESVKDQHSCVLADVNYTLGVINLINGKYDLARNKFKESWELYSAELGRRPFADSCIKI